MDFSFHLAPNAPWIALALLSLVLAGLGIWAYRFNIPPLPQLARRLLPALRVTALLLLVWLLAQPVLERARAGRGAHVVVLLDRSRSMDLPARAPGGRSRAAEAGEAVSALEGALKGRTSLRVVPFSGRLGADSVVLRTAGSTALGDALGGLPMIAEGQDLDGVVVVSDGVVNAGADPVAMARSLGVPVHTVMVGKTIGADRAVREVESSATARVGEATPVRARLTSSEDRGRSLTVRLMDGGREIGRTTVVTPGDGAEVVAEFRVTPTRPGLAVWTAVVDSLPGEPTGANNARQVALEVAPGRLGVLVVSSGLNWDLAFLRRALLGDSSLRLTTLVRERGGWRGLEHSSRGGAPGAAALRGQSVVVLDGVSPDQVSPEFDQAISGFVRGGGGLLLFGGQAPGLARFRGSRLREDLVVTLAAEAIGRPGLPIPSPEARDLLSWDDDPARGERAWRAAAPLGDLTPIRAGAGDRVLIGTGPQGPALLLSRRIGRGNALMVNGTGMWRWSLSGHDDLTMERGRRLWRRLVRWIAEPVQGEPLRVRPERWLTSRGEPVRLFANLQDRDFKPISGATVEGEVQDQAGRMTRLSFTPGTAGSYAATLENPNPGRYRVTARASRGGREMGRAASEFAVDRWSLEEARVEPDSATLSATAQAGGGRMVDATQVGRWARGVGVRALARGRTESVRLWESPWVFVIVVGALGVEWAWRRRRGLP